MLNKVQAAEYLGCTTRTLERHIKGKKIGVTYQGFFVLTPEKGESVYF